MSNLRLSRRDLVMPRLFKVNLNGLAETNRPPRLQEKYRAVVNSPLRDSAMAFVKKKFATTHPEMVRRFCAQLEK